MSQGSTLDANSREKRRLQPHEWTVPPLWVWLAGAVLIVAIAVFALWKISDSMSTGRATAPPSGTGAAGWVSD